MIITLTCGDEMSVALLLMGKSMSRAWGATEVTVSMKKMSNRKTMSVIEDMLNWGSIWCLVLSFIGFVVLRHSWTISHDGDELIGSLLNLVSSFLNTR